MDHHNHVTIGIVRADILQQDEEHSNVFGLIGQGRIAQQRDVSKVGRLSVRCCHPLFGCQCGVGDWISQLFGKYLSGTGGVRTLVILRRVGPGEGNLPSPTTVLVKVSYLRAGSIVPPQERAQLVPGIFLLGQIHDEELILGGGMPFKVLYDFGVVPLVGLHPLLLDVSTSVHKLVQALDAFRYGASPLVVLVVMEVGTEGVVPHLWRGPDGENELGIGIGRVELAVVGGRGDVPHGIDVVVLAG
mmetsp:Transcript_27074/g.78122  ORF Transcript_27074/g.78122 Transcript_27074/m.78122 type:complete len:245 (-) Transcript_27074:430-1164(-)